MALCRICEEAYPGIDPRDPGLCRCCAEVAAQIRTSWAMHDLVTVIDKWRKVIDENAARR